MHNISPTEVGESMSFFLNVHLKFCILEKNPMPRCFTSKKRHQHGYHHLSTTIMLLDHNLGSIDVLAAELVVAL